MRMQQKSANNLNKMQTLTEKQKAAPRASPSERLCFAGWMERKRYLPNSQRISRTSCMDSRNWLRSLIVVSCGMCSVRS